jgi:H+-transporting ATPase
MVSACVGLVAMGESLTILWLGKLQFHLANGQLNTFAFEILFFFSICTVFIVRERRSFWHSRPSWLLLAFCVLECALVLAVCSVGMPGLDSIPFTNSLSVLGCAFGATFIVNDVIKTVGFKTLGVT